MFNLTATDTLRTRRTSYMESMFESLIQQAARDLSANVHTREVIIPTVAKVIGASLPNSGKGHAETVKAQVTDAIDALLSEEENSEGMDEESAPKAARKKAA